MPREDAGVADGLDYPIVIVDLHEEAIETFRRHVLRDVCRVGRAPRDLDAHGIDIAREDLQRHGSSGRLNILRQPDRQRVRFLAGRAPEHPHADRLRILRGVEDALERRPRQRLEGVRVAKKARDADQQVVMKRASFFCLATHDLRVVLQTIDAMKDHPAQDATSKGARLVVREVDACVTTDDL